MDIPNVKKLIGKLKPPFIIPIMNILNWLKQKVSVDEFNRKVEYLSKILNADIDKLDKLSTSDLELLFDVTKFCEIFYSFYRSLLYKSSKSDEKIISGGESFLISDIITVLLVPSEAYSSNLDDHEGLLPALRLFELMKKDRKLVSEEELTKTLVSILICVYDCFNTYFTLTNNLQEGEIFNYFYSLQNEEDGFIATLAELNFNNSKGDSLSYKDLSSLPMICKLFAFLFPDRMTDQEDIISNFMNLLD